MELGGKNLTLKISEFSIEVNKLQSARLSNVIRNLLLQNENENEVSINFPDFTKEYIPCISTIFNTGIIAITTDNCVLMEQIGNVFEIYSIKKEISIFRVKNDSQIKKELIEHQNDLLFIIKNKQYSKNNHLKNTNDSLKRIVHHYIQNNQLSTLYRILFGIFYQQSNNTLDFIKSLNLNEIEFSTDEFIDFVISDYICCAENEIFNLLQSFVLEKLATYDYISSRIHNFSMKLNSSQFHSNFKFNSIINAIHIDDVVKLQQEISNFNINCKINELSLIENAAQYGSIHCFKYLFLNNVEISHINLSKYAVYGGNVEIIHICEQINCSFENTLDIAVKQHFIKIILWLIEKQHQQVTKDTLFICLRFGLFDIFFILLEKYQELYQDKSFIPFLEIIKTDNSTILKWCLEYFLAKGEMIPNNFGYDAIKFCANYCLLLLLSIYKSTIFSINHNNIDLPQLLIRGNSGFINLLFLTSNIRINIDFNKTFQYENNDWYPLHFACFFGNYDAVRFLLDKTDPNIPMKMKVFSLKLIMILLHSTIILVQLKNVMQLILFYYHFMQKYSLFTFLAFLETLK